MTNRTPKHLSSGFTLIEALVSLVIFVSGIIIVAQGFSVGLRALITSGGRETAAMLAESLIARIEAGEIAIDSAQEGDFGEDYPEFHWATEPEATDLVGLTEVTVKVAWVERGEEKSFQFVRLIFMQPEESQ